MDSRIVKNCPRAGPDNVGESRTSPQGGVWPMYTGGASNASGREEAAIAASLEDDATTRVDPGPVLLTALETDHWTRPDDMAVTTRSQFGRTDDSDCSLYTMQTVGSSRESSRDRARSVRSKRRLPHSGSASEEGGSEHSLRSETTGRRKLTPAKRGRGRPPTTGKYVGLTAAKQKHQETQREALKLQEGKKVAPLQANTLKGGDAKVEESVRGFAFLKENILRLEAENMRLREELAILREKTSQAQKAPLPESATKIPQITDQRDSEELTVASLRAMFEDFSRSIMERTSNMVNARIEAMGDRLLPVKRVRPPLAADNIKPGTHLTEDWPALPRAVPSKKTTVPTSTMTAGAVAPEIKKVAKKKEALKAKQAQKKPVEQQPDSPAAEPGPSTEEGWNVVARKKNKKKTIPDMTNTDATKARPQGVTKAPQKSRPKIRIRRRNPAPATAAVVITLQHDAVENGTTYKDVLQKARQEINLADLGLSEGVRVRQAATGARIMELPTSATSEMADRFAEKLRGVLAGAARITRPVRCLDIRISGLDDTITKEAVLEAVVTKTCCSQEHVKGGDIREGPGGTGTMWVQCPAPAANSLLDVGRLLIGWSSARVQLLEPRAMQCYRCLELGHTARRCTSETDRSHLCFRCGQAGHRSAACTAKPHCVVCAAAGKNPNHTVGGKGCTPPKKGRNQRAEARSAGRPQARQETAMETNNG